MRRLILVWEGGGMRNAALAAFLHRLEELGFDRRRVSAIWASSSAAVTAAKYIAGQIAETPLIYQQKLTDREVFDWWRILRGKRPANVRCLVERVCASLDPTALTTSGIKLVINILDIKDGKLYYLHVTANNFRDLLECGCAVPLLAASTQSHLVDGGTVVPLPLLPAYAEEGAADYLVLSNRPPSYQVPWHWPLRARAMFLLYGAAYRVAVQARQFYQAWRQFVQEPPSGVRVLVIQPQANLPCTRFDRSAVRVGAAITVGRQLAEQNWGRVQDFLAGEPAVSAIAPNTLAR